MDEQDYLYKYAWCYVQLNQPGERPVEKHLLSFLGPEPGGKPRPPRLSLFQLGPLRSARLSGRVREESLLRIQVEPPPRRSGKSGGDRNPTSMLLRLRPLRGPRGGNRKRKCSSDNISLPAPPCVGGRFSTPFAFGPALSPGVFELPGLVGDRGASYPPVQCARGTATPRSLREPLSAPPARVGVGAVAQGPRWRQGLFSVRCVPLFKSCQNKHCSFSRGETCTQWWKTAAVPSSH